MTLTMPISTTEWLRLFLLYAHLLLSMLALARVLAADLGLVTGKLSRELLHSTVHSIVWLLLGLWLSGLAIIWLDTGFDPALLAERSKLVLKLVSVTVLTLNGALLHRLAFPVLISDQPLNLRESILLAVTGSLSTLHWLLAAFIGVSKPLGKLPLELLLGSYALLCAATIVGSLACVGLVRRHIMHWRSTNDPTSFIDHVIS